MTDRSCSDDRGATFVIFIAAIGALLTVAAIVLDLGQARQADESNDIAADASVLAAVQELDSLDASAACSSAWTYYKANAGVTASDIVTAPNCSTFAGACNPANARTVTAETSTRTITIVSPVPDAHPFMAGQPANPAADGTPCDRLGVGITGHSNFLFSTHGAPLSSSSVAIAIVIGPPVDGGPASIVLLNAHDCEVLEADRLVQAGAVGEQPGVIAIDSDGSDCNSGDSIVYASGQGHVYAEDGSTGSPGLLTSYALGLGVPTSTAASTNGASSVIDPAPSPSTVPHGRQGIDDRYGAAIAALETTYATTSGTPAGYNKWSDSYSCSFEGGDTLTVPAGNWHIDCNKGLKVKGSAKVAIQGGDVVLDTEFTLQGTNSLLAFNCPAGAAVSATTAEALGTACGATADSQIVLREGTIEIESSGMFALPRTMLYSVEGGLDFGGGHTTYWSAPLGGDFEDLTFWSEGDERVELNGGSDLQLEGIFFTPNSEGRVRGDADININAQLFFDRLDVGGSGSVVASALLDRSVPRPIPPDPTRGLIR